MKKRNFYAKAVTRIRPQVVPLKNKYKRKEKHNKKYKLDSSCLI